ncbi:hypothetical protein AALP_AA8G316800 [Arabis alpina]|uniref:Uncharacterized protein n=1 Tax=Arabis alpina TaxID=50452 RepID=A0A087GAR5_ARAAL|nr:hypothetical protein AALP_AA8G316800 [Arabis alpina]
MRRNKRPYSSASDGSSSLDTITTGQTYRTIRGHHHQTAGERETKSMKRGWSRITG